LKENYEISAQQMISRFKQDGQHRVVRYWQLPAVLYMVLLSIIALDAAHSLHDSLINPSYQGRGSGFYLTVFTIMIWGIYIFGNNIRKSKKYGPCALLFDGMTLTVADKKFNIQDIVRLYQKDSPFYGVAISVEFVDGSIQNIKLFGGVRHLKEFF
jgi:hypothetical protein